MPDNDGGFRHGITLFSRSKLLAELNADLAILRRRVDTARQAGAATNLLEQRETAIIDQIRRLELSI